MGKYPDQWEADVALRDGSACHIRPIRPADGDRLRRFHAQLSDKTIYYRFFAPYPELTKHDVERFTQVDYEARVALVATVAGEIVGVGRYDQVSDLDAEVAFTVRDDFQGRGLGSVLLEHLAAAARERGFRRFVADVLPQNRRMAGTFTQAGYRVASELEDGVVKLAFEISPTDRLRSVSKGREQRADSRSIERLLNPRSVAVIGASDRVGSFGHEVMSNLVAGEFRGTILPIHPTFKEVLGRRAYSSVSEAPGPIDLAIVAVPVPQVESVVAECGSVGVHGLIVMSSGYSDVGPGGDQREHDLVELVRGHGMRLVGPNSLGIINTSPRVQLRAAVPNENPPRGRLAMFCQSAAVSMAALNRLARRDLGVATFVSAGNRADVSGEDLLQYWLGDQDSQVVAMYLETMAAPRKFIRVVRDVSSAKPVIIVRSGRSSQAFPLGPRRRRTELPARAVDQLIENAGVIEAGSLGELVDICGILSCQPLPTGNRVAVVGDSHELVVLTADTLATADFVVSDQVFVSTESERDSLVASLADFCDGSRADAVVLVHSPPVKGADSKVKEAILAASKESVVPIVAVLQTQEGNNALIRMGAEGAQHGSVPYFGTVEETVRSLSAVTKYARWQDRDRGEVPEYLDVDSEGARAVLEEVSARALSSSATHARSDSETIVMAESEIARLLECFGVHLWPSRPIASEDQAVAEADELGWPVALKTLDPRLSKRGALDGVRLNLENEAALRGAYLSLAAALDSEAISQFVVQQMAPAGVHCVIRTRDDALFGPVMSFGMGGTVAELLGDHAYRIPPITDKQAGRLIRVPKAAKLLFGYGGNEPADIAGLEDLLIRVGLLADEFPQIARMDLNPIIASPTGPAVLQASAWLRPATAESLARRLSG